MSLQNKKYQRAFIVGKFAPFHLGHKYLIDTALTQSEQVFVLGYSSPSFGYTPKQKDAAFRQAFSCNKNIFWKFLNEHACPKNTEHEFIHRQFCMEFLLEIDYIPDVIFSSEEYGKPFAEFLELQFQIQAYYEPDFDKVQKYIYTDIDHVLVDAERKTFPISSTKIRNEPLRYEQWSLMK